MSDPNPKHKKETRREGGGERREERRAEQRGEERMEEGRAGEGREGQQSVLALQVILTDLTRFKIDETSLS